MAEEQEEHVNKRIRPQERASGQKHISGQVLPGTQNCHFNSNSTHCAPLPPLVPRALNFRDNWTTFLKSHLNCSELGDHQFNFEKEWNISSQEFL